MSFINTRHAFRPNGVTALSDEDIRRLAPSAFAAETHESRSHRYAYIPTAEVIAGMRENGFLPMSATQARTRDAGRIGHTKHMLRFRHAGTAPAAERRVGDTFPEIVLLNAHDGTSGPARTEGDEFDALAGAVNATLSRLQGALARLNQVTGDIAHDLRTPLSRMRQRLERASRGAAGGQVPREVVDRAVADIDEVLGVFAALLRIAQIESGERRASFAEFDLSAALGDVVDALAPTVEDAGRPLSVEIEPALRLSGDRELLQQAFVNLIENAFRHTPAQAAVRVTLALEASDLVATVEDRGSGIPQADRQRVLRPFVRLDESRSTPGTGLGLSLVQAVADLHGAVLALEDADPGLRATLRLRRLQGEPWRG